MREGEQLIFLLKCTVRSERICLRKGCVNQLLASRTWFDSSNSCLWTHPELKHTHTLVVGASPQGNLCFTHCCANWWSAFKILLHNSLFRSWSTPTWLGFSTVCFTPLVHIWALVVMSTFKTELHEALMLLQIFCFDSVVLTKLPMSGDLSKQGYHFETVQIPMVHS